MAPEEEATNDDAERPSGSCGIRESSSSRASWLLGWILSAARMSVAASEKDLRSHVRQVNIPLTASSVCPSILLALARLK